MTRLADSDDGHPELVGGEARPVPAHRLGDLARLLRALRRVLFEAAQDDVLELLPDLGAEGARRLRDLVDDPVEDRLHLAGEGRLADQALVEDDAERIDVGAAVEGARGDLLRGEIRDRPDERARFRQPRLGRRMGEAEIHDSDPGAESVLARDHDVGGLDVAVHDAARVAVVEGVGDLGADVHHLAETQRLVADHAKQVRSARDRHHEEERALVPADVVDGDDGRMVHLRDDLGLALESLFHLRRQIVRGDELDGDLAVQERVAGSIHHAHASASELPEDLVAVGELRIDQSAVSVRAVRSLWETPARVESLKRSEQAP